MDYLRWERDVLRYAWRDLRHVLRKYVVAEGVVAVAGAVVTFFASSGDPLATLIGGVSVAFALGIGMGLTSVATAPYRLYKDTVPPEPSKLRELLANAAVVGRKALGQPTVSDEDFEKWKALVVAFQAAFNQCKPLMELYAWQRLSNVDPDPSAKHTKKRDDEHEAQWLQV